MLCVVPLLSFLFILHPPLFLSSVSLSFLCPTASSQPSFLVSLHTTDWSPSLSANSFTPQSKPKLGVARWLTPTSRYSYSLAGNIREPKFGSSVLPPFFLSPPCLVFFYFFGTCFSSFFCYVRQTEVEQASKWMAKPPFPLLALLFMHVIPVPAPPPPPSISLYPHLSFLTPPSFLHLFLLLYIHLFLPDGGNYSIFTAFPVCSLTVRMISPDLVIVTLTKQSWQWPEEGDERAVSGSRDPLKRRQVSLCLPLPPVCPCCIKYRVIQGWVGCSFSLITCQWAWASEVDEVKATIT